MSGKTPILLEKTCIYCGLSTPGRKKLGKLPVLQFRAVGIELVGAGRGCALGGTKIKLFIGITFSASFGVTAKGSAFSV